MNRLTSAYQISALANTSDTIDNISQSGVESDTAVANTLAKSTMALGFVKRHKKAEEKGVFPAIRAIVINVNCLRLGHEQPQPQPCQVATTENPDRPGQPLILDENGRKAKQAERCIEQQSG